MKKLILSVIKCIGFFFGWVILVSVLSIPSFSEPAVWRLWAEVLPLVVIGFLSFLFWLIEKKSIQLHLMNHSVQSIRLGIVAGLVWLIIPVFFVLLSNTMHFDGVNTVRLFPIWILAAFLNVSMQELLVRGYLYQMLKQNFSIVVATLTTTLLFVLCHGGAFDAGILPVFNIFSMSLLMTIVLEYTDSLIAPIIMHFIWNGIGALLLDGVSLANDYPSLLITSFHGNQLLSGGAYKLEGSIFVFIVNMAFIVFFLYKMKKDKCLFIKKKSSLTYYIK